MWGLFEWVFATPPKRQQSGTSRKRSMNDSSRNSRRRNSALAPRIITPIASLARTRRVVALSHIGFLFVGIANTLLGTVLPLLTERWKLNDTQGSYLFTAQFTDAIAGSALSGALTLFYA